MNNGLTPFPSDKQPVPGQGGVPGVPGGSGELALWRQSNQMDFFQGESITVSPTERPFWNGVGAAVSDVFKTIGLNAAVLFRR